MVVCFCNIAATTLFMHLSRFSLLVLAWLCICIVTRRKHAHCSRMWYHCVQAMRRTSKHSKQPTAEQQSSHTLTRCDVSSAQDYTTVDDVICT
jgi:hypothetical protein